MNNTDKVKVKLNEVEELRVENIQLRNEVDHLKELVLEQNRNLIRDWLVDVEKISNSSNIQNTLSWRITKPLRAAKNFQLKWRQDGFGSALHAVTRFLRQKINE